MEMTETVLDDAPRRAHEGPDIYFGLSPGYQFAKTKKEQEAFVKFDQYIRKAQVKEKEQLQRNVNLAARLVSATQSLRSSAGMKHVVYRIQQLSKFEKCRKETAVYLIDSLLHHMSRCGSAKDMRIMEKELEPMLINIFKRALMAYDSETRQAFAGKLMKKSLRVWKEKGWFDSFSEGKVTMTEIEYNICKCDPTLPEANEKVDIDFTSDHDEDVKEEEERKLQAGEAARALIRQATMKTGAMAKAGAPPTPAQPFFLRAPGTPGMAAFMPGQFPNQTPAPPTPDGVRTTPGTPAWSTPPTPMPFVLDPKAKEELEKGLRNEKVLGMIPSTPNPLKIIPSTPREGGAMGTLPMTPTAGRRFIPSTPKVETGLPGTPRVGSNFLPSTPADNTLRTPSGILPMTPGAAMGVLPATPMNPLGSSRHIPSTPTAAIPGTPRGQGRPIPSTPRAGLPGTPRALPGTPGMQPAPLPGTPGGMTPAGAAPFTPMPGLGPSAPFTPAAPKAAPFTPAGIAGASAPFTPAGITSAPFTPAGISAAPFTPAGPSAPFTPAGVKPAPFTPAGISSAPFTPAGTSAPFTPAFASAAPFTPGGVRSAPFTPGTATFAPQTPGGAPSAPFTPAGAPSAGPSQPFTPGMSGQPMTPLPFASKPGFGAGSMTPNIVLPGTPDPGYPGTPGTPEEKAAAGPGTPASSLASFKPTSAGEAMPKTPGALDTVLSPTSLGDAGGPDKIMSPVDEAPGDVTPTTPAFVGMPKAHEDPAPAAPAPIDETPAVAGRRDEEEEEEVPHTLSTQPISTAGSEVASSDPIPTAEATPRPLKPGQETPRFPPGQETPLMELGQETPLMPGDETPTFRAHTPAYANDVTPAMPGDITPGMPPPPTVPTEVATTRPTRSAEDDIEDAPAAKKAKKGE